jgi:hypothetical protein
MTNAAPINQSFTTPSSELPQQGGVATHRSGVPPRAWGADGGEAAAADTAVEVRISWGMNLLFVAHLSPLRPFHVGEAVGRAERVDFVLPAEKLGSVRLKLLDVVGGEAIVYVPARASATFEQVGATQNVVLAAAMVDGRWVLRRGDRVRLELDDLVFEIQGVAPARKIAAAVTLAALVTGSAAAYVAGAGVGVGGLLAAMALFTPGLSPSASDELTEERRYLISHYLDAAAEREREETKTEALVESAMGSAGEAGGGVRAKGAEGTMGSPVSKSSGGRYGNRGPETNRDPHIARQEALRDAVDFGMIGLLRNAAGGDPDALTAPWGRDDSLGNDPKSARGAMWGTAIGESAGMGGLGLTGIGEGGDGPGEGLGLGAIATVGHGDGSGLGSGLGYAGGHLARTHEVKAPTVRTGVSSFSGGRLPPETIQAIVRQNFGRFRACYENGLRQNPNLEGTVSVLFVIGREGEVSNVGGGGSLPDSGVVSCVARSFSALRFPSPDGGVVRVTYPISFHSS